MDTLAQKLKECGVDDIRFYYNNCPLVGNIFTACVMFSEDKKILARGVAICSIIDFHNKKIARKVSKSRAAEAIFKGSDSHEIYPNLHDSRDLYNIQKCFKIKSEELKGELLQKINKLGFTHITRQFEKYERIFVTIPYIYPVEKTREYFKYKSEFKPEPTRDEIQIFKLK